MKQMTVKQLKKYLKDFPDDALVYLGDDEELNGIHGAYFIQEESGDFISSISYGNYDQGGVLIS